MNADADFEHAEVAPAPRSRRVTFDMATGVVIFVVVLTSVGLLARGRSFVGAAESGQLGAPALHVAVGVGSLTISVAALFFARSRRLVWLSAPPALTLVALLGIQG